MATALDKALFASDAHAHWARRIASATDSVHVYSSSVDSSLVDLLSAAGPACSELIVVTSIRPEVVGRGLARHLTGLLALLQHGVHVRITNRRLSAHVLVCDSTLVSTGSQAFTAEARKLDSVTLSPGNSIQGSDFAATLESWMTSSYALDEETVERLVNELADAIDAVEHAQRELVDEFDYVLSEMSANEFEGFELYDIEVPEILIELSTIVDTAAPESDLAPNQERSAHTLPPVSLGLVHALTSPRRAAKKRVRAELTSVGEYWDPYNSLVTDADADMTIWQQPSDDGTVSTATLQRLRMYPLILNPSGRMGFARVGKRRITYVRQSVDWSNAIRVGGQLCNMLVSFPEVGFEAANMHITLRPLSHPTSGLELRVRFDGTDGLLTGMTPLQDGDNEQVNPRSTEAAVHALQKEVSTPTGLEAILLESLRPFRYKTLGRDNRNADAFFAEGPQHVTLFRYRNRSVLAVSDAAYAVR